MTFLCKRTNVHNLLHCAVSMQLFVVISSVGVFKNGRVEIIANDQGNRITPSYVAFTPEGERLIGDAAKNQLTTNPENTVFDIKRLIGRRWDEPSVQSDIKFYPFTVVNKGNRPNVQVKRNTLILFYLTAFHIKNLDILCWLLCFICHDQKFSP